VTSSIQHLIDCAQKDQWFQQEPSMLTQSRIKNGRYIKGEQRILIFGEVCGSTRESHNGQHYGTWCDVCAEEMDMRDACGTGSPRLCKPYCVLAA
jgi:hypothetical protein